MTVDGYWIQLKNRLVLSGSFDKTNSAVAILLASLPDIDVVQFMTNAINTRTQGIDVVLNGTWNLRKATLHLTFAGNFTHTHIFGSVQTTDRLLADSLNTNTLFNREERGKIEWGQPQNKYIFSTNYSREKTGCMLRQTLFGKTATYHATNPTLDEFFSPQVLTDVSSWYQLKPWIKLTAGANNIFNVYPDPLKNYQNMAEGRMIYSNDAMPFGYNGGYYFVSISFIW
jgi:iron complex outermembrane receptor protein